MMYVTGQNNDGAAILGVVLVLFYSSTLLFCFVSFVVCPDGVDHSLSILVEFRYLLRIGVSAYEYIRYF